jgi:hypothetical protein
MRKLLFLVAMAAFAQQPAFPPPGMRCPQRTLVLFQPGPNAAKAPAVYQEHIAYVLSEMKAGRIVVAGPANEGPAAMVFASKDWAEVEPLLKKEPFTREGVMKISSHGVWNACEVEK